MPEKVYPWRRLLAFYFDITLFALPFGLAWTFVDLDGYASFLSLYSGMPAALLRIVTALPLMALFLYRLKTTPGKWLMGMTLALPAEANFTRVYKRSLYSYVLGAGMWIVTICWFPLFFSFRTLRLTGATFWDRVFSTKVSHSKLRGGRIAAFVIILLAGSLLESLPVNMNFLQSMGAYYYSPSYCEVSVSSGSLSASAAHLDVSAETEEGPARVSHHGGSYSIDRRLCDIKSLKIRVSGDFHSVLPEGLEVELIMRDIPNALLALGFEASVIGDAVTGKVTVYTTVKVVNRYSQNTVYNGSFSHSVEPAGNAKIVEIIGG